MIDRFNDFQNYSLTKKLPSINSAKIAPALSSVVKIVFSGPESSGKTTRAQQLSRDLKYPWVAEYAREYLSEQSEPYTQADLLRIAQGQIAAEEKALSTSPDLLFCDTDLLTIKIWSEVKYGNCDPWIEEQVRSRPYDHYLLCAPDIPWTPDPLRENPYDRRALFVRYVSSLCQLERPFTVIAGKPAKRLATAHAVIRDVLEQHLEKV